MPFLIQKTFYFPHLLFTESFSLTLIISSSFIKTDTSFKNQFWKYPLEVEKHHIYTTYFQRHM